MYEFYSNKYEPEILQPTKIDLYCRWFYQTACADGKPRVLKFGRIIMDFSPIYLLIHRIRQVLHAPSDQ
jgi:hypothetical protein